MRPGQSGGHSRSVFITNLVRVTTFKSDNWNESHIDLILSLRYVLTRSLPLAGSDIECCGALLQMRPGQSGVALKERIHTNLARVTTFKSDNWNESHIDLILSLRYV